VHGLGVFVGFMSLIWWHVVNQCSCWSLINTMGMAMEATMGMTAMSASTFL
jgi:hypothetical protein